MIHFVSGNILDAKVDALVNPVNTADRELRSIAVPPLGSGLGGLAWHDVRPLISRELSGLSDVEVHVFEPRGAPDGRR